MSRRLLKRMAERLLRLAPRSPRDMRGRSLILAYHNVVPDGLDRLGDQSLHIPFAAFTRHLDLLQTHCHLTTLAELRSGNLRTDRPVVSLTFDDAYRGAVETALPELARRGIPSTVFVAPGLIGCSSFWWDALAGQSGLAADVRRRVLESGAGLYSGAAAANQLPACYGCATESQIGAMVATGYAVLGSHSWSHPNLARIDPPSLAAELARPLEWLRSFSGQSKPVLAYPYGLTSPAVEAAVRDAGYSAALLVHGGWFTDSRGPWQIPRYNVPAGLSADGLFLRLSGVLGFGSPADPAR